MGEIKFTLDEAFDIIYNNLLEDTITDDLAALRESTETKFTEQLTESLYILEDFGMLNEDEPTANNIANNKQNDYDGIFTKAMELYDKLQDKSALRVKESEDALKKLELEKQSDKSKDWYKPENKFVEITSISKMGFPKNVIFFIMQLIKWIKNNILNFIDKFTNIVRGLIGLKAANPRFTPDELKLSFNRMADIEAKYLINPDKESIKKIPSASNIMNAINGYSGKDNIVPTYVGVKPVSVFNVSPDDVKALPTIYASYDVKPIGPMTEGYPYGADDNQERGVTVVRVDTSRDLLALQETLHHFFDLFDNAFGSNDEKLFSIDDLDIMLHFLKDTLSSVKNPNKFSMASSTEVSGSFINDNSIDPAKIADDLRRTSINTNNLKTAYVLTNKQINTIAKIIADKNLSLIASMGQQYTYLSASTYQVMSEILSVIETRLKEAEEMSKKLNKMKTAYENLTTELEKYRAGLNSITGLAYTTIIQRKINDLYDASRYMTQIVQLRSNALALYLSELNDTHAIITNLNAVNTANKKKPFFKFW